MLKQLFALAVLPAVTLALGAKNTGNRNITVAFFSDSDSASCDSADTSQALILTTSTVPASFTCFNVSDIFSQSNTTGTMNGTQGYFDESTLDLPNHVDWLVKNLDKYDTKANYSRVWYEQNNGTGKDGEGVDGGWVFYLYAFDNCEQTGGDDFLLEEWPWFETSCQTREGGQCRTVPNTVKSFALNRPERYNRQDGGCVEWALLGSSANARGWSMGLLGSVVGATVLLLL